MPKVKKFDLFKFQSAASEQIATRHNDYHTRGADRIDGKFDPFLQLLQAFTGSGKTPVLAHAVNRMRSFGKIQPLVLWISKGKVVVEQTASNLGVGGKYHPLVSDWTVISLADVKIQDIRDSDTPLIITSTVAAFNRDETKREGLSVYTLKQDEGDKSVWEAIKDRSEKTALFVVYDEGHNSTDKQLDILLDLSPKAIILSSATMELTPALVEIARRQKFTGEQDKIFANQDPVVTYVPTADVVEMQLIKDNIHVGGRSGRPEAIIREMNKEFNKLVVRTRNGANWIVPKCIYVSDTNRKSGMGEEEDSKIDFPKRKARPIVIWRTLVNECGVDPDEIAVYCSLKGSKFPDEFHLFRGGDRDYNEFIKGNYKHIIFNLSLQEGWDDPNCYFAYIDKEMGSKTQITQVIGRVMRQPDARYGNHDALNTAHFFIRFRSKGEFMETLAEVKEKIEGEIPQVKITSSFDSKIRPAPFKPKKKYQLPTMAIDGSEALELMSKSLKDLPLFIEGDTKGLAEATDVQIKVSTGRSSDPKYIAQGSGQPIKVREYLREKLSAMSPEAYNLLDTSVLDSKKLDTIIEIGSIACKNVDREVVELCKIYETNVEIRPDKEEDPYLIGEHQPRASAKVYPYKNAIHKGYDGLSPDEQEFAKALDKTKLRWARNPAQKGYAIPLPLTGVSSRRFFPDFIVFSRDCIWLIDPKGGHLLGDAIRNKLLYIEKVKGLLEIRIALVARGEYDKDARPVSDNGVTLFHRRSGNSAIEHCETYADAVKRLLG